jgi:excisionase family DNA binding protein
VASDAGVARRSGRAVLRQCPHGTTWLLRLEQVTKMLSISRDKVYYLLRTRQLRSIKIGKSRRITDAHLAAVLASLEADDAA